MSECSSELLLFLFFMRPLIIVFSSLTTLLFVPLSNILSRIVGAIDRASGGRKIHERDTPRLGGVAIFLSFFIFALIALPMTGALAALLSGGALIVAAGVADDTYGIPPLPKLTLQIAAAAVAASLIALPPNFSLFGLVRFPVSGALAFLFAVLRIVFMINAVNFADGLDGLAGGLSLVALLSLFLLAVWRGESVLALILLTLSFSVFGFIPHNVYRASAFMGDSGSQFLGFSIAVLSISLSESVIGSATSFFLAVPIADVWYSVTRRILTGKSPFIADKGHIHHALISHGVSHPAAVRILIFTAALTSAATLFFIFHL